MISVIIPAYNAERFLQACVDSVVGQTARDWEMVIVDDGSTDSTPGICDRAAVYDPRIRVVHSPTAGFPMPATPESTLHAATGCSSSTPTTPSPPTLSRAFRLWPGDTGPTSRAPDSVRPRRRSPEVVAGQPRRNVPRPGNGRGDDALPGQAQPFRMGKLYDSRLFDGLRFRKRVGTKTSTCSTASSSAPRAWPSRRGRSTSTAPTRRASCTVSASAAPTRWGLRPAVRLYGAQPLAAGCHGGARPPPVGRLQRLREPLSVNKAAKGRRWRARPSRPVAKR